MRRRSRSGKQRQIRSGPQWDPTFRAPLLDADKWDDTRGRKVYRAKTLVGIWATAPFLHNGSVPTLYDLLTPAAERPVTFPTGQREYDPVKLGIQTDRSKYVLPPGLTGFPDGHAPARQLEHRPRVVVLPDADRRHALRHHRVPQDLHHRAREPGLAPQGPGAQ